ncbi:SDR family oxidoreductase [Novosphingobium sp. PP1Y]|uniref:SDR family oxidoreductase n=1 Tax=Novosphingobium sp. PP1Y TaxID=702113 RepID=UPI00020EFAD2|nr:SDR family oxidoreductase [Novosphingobium sp. PP1Y]CCA90023.1 3-oxoacyl-[acyl-carrier protein] reductase [Novosphingobium sp. PP1Y]
MDLGLNGKVALVMGASSGLGVATARALAAEGAKVALAARRVDVLARLSKEIEAAGGSALVVEWDLAEPDRTEPALDEIEAQLGPIDILVANTGGPPPRGAEGIPHDLWLEQFRVMVLSIVGIANRLVPGMRRRGWGRIVTFASSGVIVPIPNLALSNALRLSLVGWSKTLAAEVAADGVTVNVLAPGRINTDRVRSLDNSRAIREGKDVSAVVEASHAAIPARRYGTPEEFAAVATFLAGVPASYVTGSIVRVDGGLIPVI